MSEKEIIKRPAVILIGSRIIQDGTEEKTESRSHGFWESRPDKDVITYTEIISEGEDAVPVCLTVRRRERTGGFEAEIKKDGFIRSEMLFIEDERTGTVYETPMGNLMFDIYCKRVSVEKNPSEAEIHLDYLLLGGDEVLSDASVRILVLAQ